MFQFHRVERATVGVDTDEKIAIFLEIDHRKSLLPAAVSTLKRRAVPQTRPIETKFKNNLTKYAFSAKSSFSLYPGRREKKGGPPPRARFRRSKIVRFNVFSAPPA
jgi:hypothetical protein